MVRFPSQLETDRLVLRSPSRRDARRLLKAVVASQTELRQWMPWAVDAYDLDKARAFCEGAAHKLASEEEFTTLLIPKHRRRVIGCCSLTARDWGVPMFEIGYWLRSDQVGNGYATEAARAMAELAFRSLAAERVELRIDDLNVRSYAVAQRLGFEWEATLKANERGTNGELRNTRIYALFGLSRLL
ncbi:MAG: GNAT family N-acetyltransferase [Gammaproteobacteria bacterium]|nr:GNAT family N-acetyltransferase [Gammaproteobacteria bacterium]